MNESPPLPPLTPAHLAPRGRQFRSISDSSPTRQRNTDDLLSNLTPRTVADALRNPSGTLKACIDAATPAEQAFALKVALASNNILEWLEELSSWPWPARGGSAGFEMPAPQRTRLSSSDSGGSGSEPSEASETPHPAHGYIGCLGAADVVRYERRLDEIGQGLEDLNIEEIKSQVLNNHIMPLSRPGTPMLDSRRSTISSLSSFATLDDLTALITATTVQALPNLSKLTRLMNAWSLRLLVLRKVPVFLASIADAEVALRSGWNAISLSVQPGRDHGHPNSSSSTGSATLSRGEFDVMKSVLERKVAKAGRDLDAMLDMLEGQPDTLPEDWVDRVDALERGYGEWTVACERKIKETDLARVAREFAPAESVPEQPPSPQQGESGGAVATEIWVANGSVPAASLERGQPSETASPREASTSEHLNHRAEGLLPVINIRPIAEEKESRQVAAGASDGSNGAEDPAAFRSASAETTRGHGVENPPGLRQCQSESDSELSAAAEGDAPQARLQASPFTRPGSEAEPSTVIHGAPSIFTDSFSSDLLDHGTPERPRRRDIESEGGRSDNLDAPDFPSFRSSARSMSVSFDDKPTVTEPPSFPSPPSTPTKSSIMEDDIPTEPNSPSVMTLSAEDDQLQRQIGEILESVPAKIRLTSEPPAINLNPPDFKMPTARKPSKPDGIPRSQSSMSMRSTYSRSGTPSFTLAPAYGRSSRPRHQRGNQDIKLYHLSRSNGEAPIKLFIRCVGEHGERVMVRVGGGWADLGEYLKEYASHHLRRSAAGSAGDSKVEVKDIPRPGTSRLDSSPPSRPASAMDAYSPGSPLRVRKTRRPAGLSANANVSGGDEGPSNGRPKPPPAATTPRHSNASRLDAATTTPPSEAASSPSSSRFSWDEEDSLSLGMAGPRAKQIDMLSEESRAWVESVKEKVRLASGELSKLSQAHPHAHAPHLHGQGQGHDGNAQQQQQQQQERPSSSSSAAAGGALLEPPGMFGEIGKVGSTKRLFRRG